MLINHRKYYLHYRQHVVNSINNTLRGENYVNLLLAICSPLQRIVSVFNRLSMEASLDIEYSISTYGIETYFKKVYAGCDIIITTTLRSLFQSCTFDEDISINEISSCKFDEDYSGIEWSSCNFDEDILESNVTVSFDYTFWSGLSTQEKETIEAKLYEKMIPTTIIKLTTH